MAIIKCKMCGGDLNISDESVAVCKYCGTQQTVPSADSEKKLALFGRANRLRLSNEFDKAAGVYESIVAEFPDEAEAYWGLVLCRYGIEYVDDPATGKKIPTCHRSSFESVLEDGDFEQACENADAVARKVYREEAKAIEELRKSILEVSGKEEPYDIFICYKESDDKGERTIDSVIAQDVYEALTEKGYRVFFSRISLEDKLGTAYEPYIFAALNSAKVMLAFGTDYEYFNAVWVKNEWSRFLALIAAGQKKTLIPCYKGIDAYDLPKEFAKLQAQDMGKVGAVQDLLRGIDKILGKIAPPQVQPVVQQMVVSGGPNTAALLKRGQMALEDGDWAGAKKHYDQVLNMDAECAEAYLGLAMAETRNRSRAELLKNCDTRSVSSCGHLSRAKKYASGELAVFFEQLEQAQTAARASRLEALEAEGFARLDEGADSAEAARSAFQKALALDPHAVKALWGMTVASETSEDKEKYWRQLEEASPDISEGEKEYLDQADKWGVWDYLAGCKLYGLQSRVEYAKTLCDATSGGEYLSTLLWEGYDSPKALETLIGDGQINLNTPVNVESGKGPPLLWLLISKQQRDFENQKACVQLLLKHGANPNATVTVHTSGGTTHGTVHSAYAISATGDEHHCNDLLKLLLEHGADPNAVIKSEQGGEVVEHPIVGRMFLKYQIADTPEEKVRSDLFFATYLDHGADINAYYKEYRGGQLVKQFSVFTEIVICGNERLIKLCLQEYHADPRTSILGIPAMDEKDTSILTYIMRRSKIFGGPKYVAKSLGFEKSREIANIFKENGWS